MQDKSAEPDKIGREFDEDACDFCDRYRKKGLSQSSNLLLNFIMREGIQGGSVVDLGCGAGGFSIQLLKEGAGSATGFDLSSNMIDSAIQLAKAEGLQGRTKFVVGNGATAELPTCDVVIMDKVLCCYPEWQPLISNAIGSSQRMVGFIVPRDVGIAKLPFRLGVRLVNFFSKRRGNIQFYLHPLNMVDRTLRESGFTQLEKRTKRFWLIFLYSRESNKPGEVNKSA